MNISATDLNKRPGQYLDAAIKEPIIVEKSGRPAVVMVSYAHYQEMEDAFWGQLAQQADQEPSLGPEETMRFLMDKD